MLRFNTLYALLCIVYVCKTLSLECVTHAILCGFIFVLFWMQTSTNGILKMSALNQLPSEKMGECDREGQREEEWESEIERTSEL
jgi:hypothetical protein